MKQIASLSGTTARGARPAQEDFALVEEEKRILVVADGFGGPEAGVIASRTACEAVRGFLVKEAGDQDATLPFVLRSYFSLAGNVLFNALIHANRAVKAANRGKGVHQRGGASVIAAYMDGDLLALASVGACSATLIRGGCAAELVMPRTYEKLLDPFGRELKPSARVPLSALGCSEDVEPEIFEYRVRPGDWLLLATDGLSEAQAGVSLATYQASDDFSAAFGFLKEQAEKTDNLDNSAFILVRF